MRRWLQAGLAVIAAMGLMVVSMAHAGAYAVGQRVECDATQSHAYYRKATVIAFQPGDGFNGHDAGSDYFYRVRYDDGDAGGALCRTEDMRALAAPAPPSIPAAVTPAPIAATVTAATQTTRSPVPVAADAYAIGQRVECDGSETHTAYRKATVIAFQPGDGFNGHDAGSGYFYRVRYDDGAAEGLLCRTEDMRPLAATAQAVTPPPEPATPAAAPAPAPAALAQVTPRRAVMPCPTQGRAKAGAPSLTLAKTLIKCQWEGESSDLHTINFDWESATIGKARPWKQTWSGWDMGTGVPGSTLVYPVTGTWLTRTYSSSGVVTVETHGVHNCYINAQHVWQCGLGDSVELKRDDVPTP